MREGGNSIAWHGIEHCLMVLHIKPWCLLSTEPMTWNTVQCMRSDGHRCNLDYISALTMNWNICRYSRTLCTVDWQVLREKIRRHIIVPAKRQLIWHAWIYRYHHRTETEPPQIAVLLAHTRCPIWHLTKITCNCAWLKACQVCGESGCKKYKLWQCVAVSFTQSNASTAKPNVLALWPCLAQMQ